MGQKILTKIGLIRISQLLSTVSWTEILKIFSLDENIFIQKECGRGCDAP